MFTLDKYVGEMLFRRANLYWLVRNSATELLYFGLFLAPIGLLVLPESRHTRRALAISSISLAGLLFLGLWKANLRMPIAHDWIHGYGLGPVNLSGSQNLPVSSGFWFGVTLASGAGAGLLLGRLGLEMWERRKSLKESPRWLILAAFASVYLGVFLVRPFFDRYMTAALPPLIAILLVPTGRSTRTNPRAVGLCLFLILVFGVAAVAGTRDLLVHNRARWSLLNELLAAGVSPERIDGGGEFGGRYNYDFDRAPFKKLDDPPRRWVVDDAYVVSLSSQLSGYRPIASREYRRILPPRVERLVVYCRNNEPPPEGFSASSM